MAGFRQKQVSAVICRMAADFLGRESNRNSLITVTRTDVSADLGRALVYLTVLPPEAEEQALEFAKRRRADFRNFVKKNTRMRAVPRFDFEIDGGEKNRQHLDFLGSD